LQAPKVYSKGVKQLSCIETLKLEKIFPGVKAIDGIDLTVKIGEVHAMVGANGAGKSTFAKVISGVFSNYGGQIKINGQEKILNSPYKSLKNGIVCVHQEIDTSIINYLTIAENLLLFRRSMIKGNSWINWSKLYSEAENLLEKVNIPVIFNVKQKAVNLSLADKQLLVIIRAIDYGSKYLIFDEPTAPLSQKEVSVLFSIINNLKTRGFGMLYISHRMPEVFSISDRITVLRNGQKINTVRTQSTNTKEIIGMMLGDQKGKFFVKESLTIGKTILEVKDIKVPGKVNGVNFKLKEGEILGITGLVGAGKTELARAIFGADKKSEGSIKIKGKKIEINNPTDAINNGIYLVPEERHKEGLLINEDVKYNLTLPSLGNFCKFSIIKENEENKAIGGIISNLKIVLKDSTQLVKNLSGGNQQKISIGKWFLKSNFDRGVVFIFDDPTKGIDVGAKQEVYNLCNRLAKEGVGIIYISPEIQEIVSICDRILIMYNKKIVAEQSRKEINQESILNFATGGTSHGI